MSESKRTKGPWARGGINQHRDIIYGVDSRGEPKPVALVYGGPRAEEEANICLLDASEDLLEACKAARAELEHAVPSGCWATGPLTGDRFEDLVVCHGCRVIGQIDDAIAKAEPKIR